MVEQERKTENLKKKKKYTYSYHPVAEGSLTKSVSASMKEV